VTTLLGTAHCPDYAGSLLYLEDVGEAVYRVDRMLTHLRMAGVFERASGVLFGQFESGRESGEDGPLEAAIEDLAERVPCPVFKGLPYGHGRSRKVMPVGTRGIVEDGALKIEDWGNPL
jgi:muramoyltetrapeptide carboxypeptidase